MREQQNKINVVNIMSHGMVRDVVNAINKTVLSMASCHRCVDYQNKKNIRSAIISEIKKSFFLNLYKKI
jgi:hypothetical protein